MPCRSWSRCSSSGRTGGGRSYKRPSDRSFIFFLRKGRKSAKGYGTNETRLSTNCWTASFPLRKYVGDRTVHFVRTAPRRHNPDHGPLPMKGTPGSVRHASANRRTGGETVVTADPDLRDGGIRADCPSVRGKVLFPSFPQMNAPRLPHETHQRHPRSR